MAEHRVAVRQNPTEMDVLAEQWEMLAEEARKLTRRWARRSLAFDVKELKKDFGQSLTADAKEIDQWLKENKVKGYSRARLEWIESFHMLVWETDEELKFRIPKQVEKYPWWEWYAWLRGDPPASFPSHLNWRVCLHRAFLHLNT